MKKVLTNKNVRDNIIELHARVVELADSLDSGSSVQYARAGSSPASRTKETVERLSLFLSSRWSPKQMKALGNPEKSDLQGLFALYEVILTYLQLLQSNFADLGGDMSAKPKKHVDFQTKIRYYIGKI